ncbi:Uncharacterised protein [Halioglobus japonicus]|nr:Uncharacterised protein [Halioglobus japonicus]
MSSDPAATAGSDAQWVSRTTLPVSKVPQSLVFGGDPADSLVPVSLEELGLLRQYSSATWALAGIKSSDRVLVSTVQDGGFPVATAAEVIAPLCSGVTYASPRGRLRLLHTIKAFKPTVWVTTPCAALDFLARLYMEFNVDPFELGIEHIVLVGEVASAGAHKRLADEFESVVTDLYCEPIFGAALALRTKEGMQSGEAGLLALASLTEDTIVSSDWKADSNAEIVLTLNQIEALKGFVVRTGHVVAPDQAVNSFHHTVGDRLLARGRWIPLSLMSKSLKLIDGLQAWQLQIERGEGTLDRITLKMGLNRESLIGNPMWNARIREAVAAVTPLAVTVETYHLPEDEPQPQGLVVDMRDHHLGGGEGLKPDGGWPL